MMDQPIQKAMNKPEAAGRMVQWAIELSQFDIEYHPLTAIKSQALADFIVEFTAHGMKKTKRSFGRSIQMGCPPRREGEQVSSSSPLKKMC